MTDPGKAQLARVQVKRAPRYRVHLAVKYSRAEEFVREYASNLSTGGLFVVGAQHLMMNKKIGVEIDLPGKGSFRVTARVAHLVDEETAAASDRAPGAGFEIVDAPPDFQAALTEYLLRLGRRTDSKVLVSDPTHGLMLEVAGYQVGRAPSPGELAAKLAQSDTRVIAVVIAAYELPAYQAALGDMSGDLFVTAEESTAIDTLLTELDTRLE